MEGAGFADQAERTAGEQDYQHQVNTAADGVYDVQRDQQGIDRSPFNVGELIGVDDGSSGFAFITDEFTGGDYPGHYGRYQDDKDDNDEGMGQLKPFFGRF